VRISIVVPTFNEEEGIRLFLLELRKVLEVLPYDFEVLLVNDGSTDDTISQIKSVKWDKCKVLNLVSNAGHMAALEAGLNMATGDVIITMDSDLQHPVDCIPLMVDRYLHGGCDVVLGIRERSKNESLLKRKLSEYFYQILSLLSNTKIEKDAGDFRLMSRGVVDTLLKLPEKQKVFRFLVTSFGFKIETIKFIAPQRMFGSSKYSYKHLWKFAITSLIGFSTAPLTAIFVGGLVIFVISGFYVCYLFLNYLRGNTPLGWTSLAVLLVSLSSIQIIALGLIGRYISEILGEVRGRPRYLIRNVENAEN
jgi:glycosyltransferase involved in cell wall biosynthesis